MKSKKIDRLARGPNPRARVPIPTPSERCPRCHGGSRNKPCLLCNPDNVPEEFRMSPPVCVCGWYAGRFSNHRCNPEMTKVADRAIKAARDQLGIEATKLGYGDGKLTFEVDERTHIQTSPHANGTFAIEDVFMLDDLSHDELIALLDAIKRLRQGAR